MVLQRNANVIRVLPNLPTCQQVGYTFIVTGRVDAKRSDVLYYDHDGTLIREVIHCVTDALAWSQGSRRVCRQTVFASLGMRHAISGTKRAAAGS